MHVYMTEIAIGSNLLTRTNPLTLRPDPTRPDPIRPEPLRPDSLCRINFSTMKIIYQKLYV